MTKKKKEPGLDDFENVQCFQMAKYSKRQKWLLKVWHTEMTKYVTM